MVKELSFYFFKSFINSLKFSGIGIPFRSDLAENAESESVRLGATRDLLDRAGFRPVDRHEIVKEKSVEELNAQLVSLVGENGAEMLISAFKSRRSISGPELAG